MPLSTDCEFFYEYFSLPENLQSSEEKFAIKDFLNSTLNHEKLITLFNEVHHPNIALLLVVSGD